MYIYNKQNNSVEKYSEWISRKDKLPSYGEEVDISFEGTESDGMGRFAEQTTCMMAGIDGGYGYFQDEFEDLENHLVLPDVTHWRKIIKSYPVSGTHSWEDKQELQERKDYFLESKYNVETREYYYVARPLPVIKQESETELWQEAFLILESETNPIKQIRLLQLNENGKHFCPNCHTIDDDDNLIIKPLTPCT